MQHHPAAEILAGYLLDALEPEEARNVHVHLVACDECTATLADVNALLSTLPETVDDITPSAGLKTSILDAARPTAAAVPTPIRSAETPKFTRPRWVPGLALAAVIALAAVLGGLVWAVVGGNSESNNGLIEALTGNSKNTVLPMNGTDAAPGVRAALLAPSGVDRVYVVASNVPQPPSGQAYHLYLYENGAPIKAATLTPDNNGHISAVLNAPLSRFSSMEVDLQPVGTETPGGSAVLKSSLP